MHSKRTIKNTEKSAASWEKMSSYDVYDAHTHTYTEYACRKVGRKEKHMWYVSVLCKVATSCAMQTTNRITSFWILSLHFGLVFCLGLDDSVG